MSPEPDVVRMRLNAARVLLGRQGIDLLLVTPSPDLRYLVGYTGNVTERLIALVLRSHGPATMILPHFERAHFEHLAPTVDLRTWSETEDPFSIVAELGLGAAVVAVNEAQPARILLDLQRALPHVKTVSGASVLGVMRLTKAPDEIAALRAAHRAADDAFAALCALPLTGLSERTVARRFADLLISCGSDTVGFATVATGPHSGFPHHTPSDRVIERGDVVLLDFGGRIDGYVADVTRTVTVGEPPDAFLEIHELVRKAQLEAIAAIAPGVQARDVDEAARRVIRDAGFGDAFPHRVGHGLGLEVHEPPYLHAANPQVLEAGMVFSVEPGVYFRDRFGVRIEDTVLVTINGSEVLSGCSREPLELA